MLTLLNLLLIYAWQVASSDTINSSEGLDCYDGTQNGNQVKQALISEVMDEKGFLTGCDRCAIKRIFSPDGVNHHYEAECVTATVRYGCDFVDVLMESTDRKFEYVKCCSSWGCNKLPRETESEVVRMTAAVNLSGNTMFKHQTRDNASIGGINKTNSVTVLSNPSVPHNNASTVKLTTVSPIGTGNVSREASLDSLPAVRTKNSLQTFAHPLDNEPINTSKRAVDGSILSHNTTTWISNIDVSKPTSMHSNITGKELLDSAPEDQANSSKQTTKVDDGPDDALSKLIGELLSSSHTNTSIGNTNQETIPVDLGDKVVKSSDDHNISQPSPSLSATSTSISNGTVTNNADDSNKPKKEFRSISGLLRCFKGTKQGRTVKQHIIRHIKTANSKDKLICTACIIQKTRASKDETFTRYEATCASLEHAKCQKNENSFKSYYGCCTTDLCNDLNVFTADAEKG